jgi:hypothetical protein
MRIFIVFLLMALFSLAAFSADSAKVGVSVSYQLPTTGVLPQTYRVTLAIVDVKNPDWIISQFAAGVARTVTVENGGKFEEKWNGLDDNFMPVPPGDYGVKAIYMPATKWDIDGEYHTVVPKFLTTAEAWRAMPGDGKQQIITGDPVNSPIGDVDVSKNGIATFCYQYLENSRNFYIADFNKPINYDQIKGSYDSGGAAGGNYVATDGTLSWVYEGEGFVFRTDGKRFGKQDGRYRKGVYMPEGYVTAMAAQRDDAGKSFLYLAERGKLSSDPKAYSRKESPTEKVNKIIILNGETAEQLGEISVINPLGMVARWGDKLWVLNKDDKGYLVSNVLLKAGLPDGELKPVFTVPDGVNPSDLEVDSHDRIYIADAKANKVYQYTIDGKLTRTFGKLAVQKSGSYDSDTFMAPGKLSCWRDADGKDRLVVVELFGPDRVSEWNVEDGTEIREWLSAQTFANAGYVVDPRQSDKIYILGHGGWLIRFKVDYKTGEWKTEAVWPDVCNGFFNTNHTGFPRMLYHGDTRYIAWNRGNFIYREAGDRWLPSAAVCTVTENKETKRYIWHDANGDGKVQEEEYKPYQSNAPAGTQRYWGESFLDDFSLVAIQNGTCDVYRLPAESFDAFGNPVYSPTGWKKLLTDPIMKARQNGTAIATYGGNEIANKFTSAWAMCEGSMTDGFYLTARGPDLSANYGAQQKLSRYVPDGKGGFKIQWRVGRMAIHGNAEQGEIYGAIHVMPPIGGLVTLVDQTRMGMILFTDEGMYVDTLFPDQRKTGSKGAGAYSLPGEFFTGYSYANKENNKIYLALGKTTPMLFEIDGWSGTGNSVKKLDTVQKTVTIAASQIATAPDFALAVRKQSGGGSSALVARFAPMPGGGPALDGTMNGWESCEPVTFSPGTKQLVEVRCGFDQDNIYLRWHTRLGQKFDPKALEPAERIFTHDREADTMSFYIQGDPNAKPATNTNGRSGDVRFVFGLFKDKEVLRPATLAMYPKWYGKDKPSPLTYKTATMASFEHVGLLADAKMGHVMDADGQGFVISAAIPRNNVPMLPIFEGDYVTQVNFDATFGGHNRFWWANADGSATRETYDEPTEARLYPGSWSQAKFEQINNLPIRAWQGLGPFGFAKLTVLKHREERPEICKTLSALSFPPEKTIDFNAVYKGELTQTRQRTYSVKWKPANINGDQVSFDTLLGWKGYEEEGTAYLVTWVNSPKPAELKLKVLDEHGHHAIRAWLNDAAVPMLLGKGKRLTDLQFSIDSDKPITLKAGWNKLLVRYDQVWGGMDLGIKVDATPDVLWSLKLVSKEPEELKVKTLEVVVPK